ncbi:MAG: nitrilase-related carbon-nitrogen hydrolase [Calditrichia bacterium]
MRIGYYQFRPLFGKVEKNRRKVEQALQQVKADLLVLPELAFTGYHFRDKEELLSMAEDPADSPTLRMLKQLCRNGNFHIVSGFAEKQGDEVFNSALLVGPGGLVHTYRKIQLFAREKEMFTPGNIPLQVQQVKNAKIGMMVCFDWIFPEVTRTLALLGAEVICHPSNLVLSYCQQAMLTRCLENHLFAITCNRFGADKRPHGILRFTGQSQVVAPKGELLHRSPSQKEELFITTIKPESAREKNITEQNHLFSDRRPEYYSPLCKAAGSKK